jgi:hypothetical protein
MQATGRYAEAVAFLEQGRRDAEKVPGWNQPTETWLATARRRLERRPRLEEVLRGAAEAEDAVEVRDAALHAAAVGRDRDALRLFRDAERRQRDLVADFGPGDDGRAVRSVALEAARSAARLLGTNPPEAEAADLRREALGWLRLVADAATAAARVPLPPFGGGTDPAALRRHLGRILEDPAFEPLRDEKAIDRFPDAEIAEHYAVWRDLRRAFWRLPLAGPI